MKLKLSEIGDVVKGQSILFEDGIVDEYVFDSRNFGFSKHALFLAVRTSKNDGHRYISEMINKGISNFLVEEIPEGMNTDQLNFICVKDTVVAFQQLASYVRNESNLKAIAITGSNGKTVVKEWLSNMLEDDFQLVKTPHSYNSQLGAPLSLMQIEKYHELGVFEAGISQPGEMSKLAKMIQPNIGILTNIGEAHLENFKDKLELCREKVGLFASCEKLIYCKDYPEIDTCLDELRFDEKKRFSWSFDQKATFSISQVTKTDSHTSVKGQYNNVQLSFTLPFTDSASIENALHCVVAMKEFGIADQEISNRLMGLQQLSMRLEVKEGINDCTIIDDSYSSDLMSLSVGLDLLNQQRQERKSLIISDIEQSGKSNDELKNVLSELLQKKSIDKLYTIGHQLNGIQLQDCNTQNFADVESFIREIDFASFKNEAILLKGARVFRFERIAGLLQKQSHETVLQIDLGAMEHNYRYFKNLLKPDTKVMVMVKAFGYGSGSHEIARFLAYHNVDYLAVAYVDEGVELRKLGVNIPIMVMNPEWSSLEMLIKYNLEPEIYSFRILHAVIDAVQRSNRSSFPIHLKIDTGMHRLGFDPSDTGNLLDIIQSNGEWLSVKSVFTHLAVADETGQEDFTKSQITQFDKIANQIEQSLGRTLIKHVLNSAGILRFSEYQYDMVRLGIGVYGISSIPEFRKNLAPVSSLQTIVSQIRWVNEGESVGYGRTTKMKKKTKIATVPVGYADGIDRSLGHGNWRMKFGQSYLPIVGKVCMDMCMLDATDVEINEGDSIQVFGLGNDVYQMAEKLNTIPYEILATLSSRVKRVFLRV